MLTFINIYTVYCIILHFEIQYLGSWFYGITGLNSEVITSVADRVCSSFISSKLQKPTKKPHEPIKSQGRKSLPVFSLALDRRVHWLKSWVFSVDVGNWCRLCLKEAFYWNRLVFVDTCSENRVTVCVWPDVSHRVQPHVSCDLMFSPVTWTREDVPQRWRVKTGIQRKTPRFLQRSHTRATETAEPRVGACLYRWDHGWINK